LLDGTRSKPFGMWPGLASAYPIAQAISGEDASPTHARNPLYRSINAKCVPASIRAPIAGSAPDVQVRVETIQSLPKSIARRAPGLVHRPLQRATPRSADRFPFQRANPRRGTDGNGRSIPIHEI